MRLFKAGLLALVCILALIAVSLKKAKAHSWYPPACCSDRDCYPIETDQLVEQEGGSWKYLPTGQVFPKDKVFPSQDNKFHVCINPINGHAYCAFILQGS